MKKIKAIIFDFDGVIADSVGIKTRAFAYLFRNHPESVVDAVVKYHIENGGQSRYVKFRHYYENILKIEYTDAIGERLADEFSKFVLGEVIKCPYIKGAREFIEAYYNDYMFFIVSGTPDDEIKLIVERKGLSSYFKEVCGTPKKKGEWVRVILEKYKLLPVETVFIGDALDDYKGANANGCFFIGVVIPGAYNPYKDLKINHLVEDLQNLESIIKLL